MKDYKGMKAPVALVVRPMWAKVLVRMVALALVAVALGYVVGLIEGRW